VQNAPNGEQWEVYTVLADSTVFCPDDDACCSSAPATA
jgi:hypothetical protein